VFHENLFECYRESLHHGSRYGLHPIDDGIGIMAGNDGDHATLLPHRLHTLCPFLRQHPRVREYHLQALVLSLIPRDKVSSDNEDGEYGAQRGTPYGMLRRFLQSPSDLPCGAPPWGTLTAVDMAKGTIRWQIPLGSMVDFGGAHGAVPPGSISFGGPITTEGGLVFIAGATDSRIRAFNTENGKEIWNAILPAAGNATPMTYEINGKQYLVIAWGGHQRIREESLGDSVVAFALP
jgi:quinoprotein glucose dehydrogenase